MIDYYFFGMIYEGIVLLIALSLLIKTISNYIKVRHKLSLLLFLVILCYVCAIFFSWLSKVLNAFSNIDYIINNDVPDPNTPLSWILLRITDFRISYAFLTVGIAISFLFKIKVFEEEFNKIKKSKKNQKIYVLLDVFENIFINSIRYNDNSVIEILIKISKLQKDGIRFLKMEFMDNGTGISDDRKKIIFQKGYKKEKQSKGMGLGLSLVKKIIESYNGQIWVEDKIEGDFTKGSNFIVLIPEE